MHQLLHSTFVSTRFRLKRCIKVVWRANIPKMNKKEKRKKRKIGNHQVTLSKKGVEVDLNAPPWKRHGSHKWATRRKSRVRSLRHAMHMWAGLTPRFGSVVSTFIPRSSSKDLGWRSKRQIKTAAGVCECVLKNFLRAWCLSLILGLSSFFCQSLYSKILHTLWFWSISVLFLPTVLLWFCFFCHIMLLQKIWFWW